MAKLELAAKLDVLVVLGSLSDKDIAAQMAPVFTEFGVAAQFEVCSAHRDHERLSQLVHGAEQAGAQVFIGVAGMAAHLPGVIAALTARPVIGVPVKASLKGLDALLSIAQMPPGIPVACVAVGGGRNAALLAVEILALGNGELAERLQRFREAQREQNRAAGQRLRDELARDE